MRYILQGHYCKIQTCLAVRRMSPGDACAPFIFIVQAACRFDALIAEVIIEHSGPNDILAICFLQINKQH